MLFTEHDEILREENAGFRIRALIDHTSRRLWVFQGEIEDYPAFKEFVFSEALRLGFGKIVYPCPQKYAAGLQKVGFEAEARAEGFFNGDPGYFMALFTDPARKHSDHLVDEVDMLRRIIEKPQTIREHPDGDFDLRPGGRDDLEAMGALFAEVFESYPTPVHDPAYLATLLNHGVRFLLAWDGPKLAGVAAVEIEEEYGRAEMTDCATLPAYRGRGLASSLLRSLENDCSRAGIKCFYSLSRAGQYGVNLVFHRLGYRYRGTLLNNAHIGGRFEDLNVWVKYPVQS